MIPNVGCEGLWDENVINCLFRCMVEDTSCHGRLLQPHFAMLSRVKDVIVPNKPIKQDDFSRARNIPHCGSGYAPDFFAIEKLIKRLN